MTAASPQQILIEVDLDKIHLNPYQPRRGFAPEELEGLVQSIRSVGLLHPPLVRPIGENGEGFELISGERRLRAAQLAGLQRISVVIAATSKMQYSAEAALIENIQRVDLNPIDIAKGLQRLLSEFGLQQEDLARRVGKKRSTIANYLRLLLLPQAIQEGIVAEKISMGHAKAILSLDKVDLQIYLYELVLNEHLSVRETERSALKMEALPKKKRLIDTSSDCYLKELQERLQQHFGTKVTLQGQGSKGKLCIEYYNLDDLDRLLQLWGIKTG